MAANRKGGTLRRFSFEIARLGKKGAFFVTGEAGNCARVYYCFGGGGKKNGFPKAGRAFLLRTRRGGVDADLIAQASVAPWGGKKKEVSYWQQNALGKITVLSF